MAGKEGPIHLVANDGESGDASTDAASPGAVDIDETGVDESFEDLLRFLKRTRGFDFSGYKRTSLMRRVSRRMEAVEVAGYDDYIDFLQVHPEEFMHLFNMILINVTSFFRDPLAWEYLKDHVLPKLLEGPRQIRVWSAGCASGEEAYTAAILLAEILGDDEFVSRVKIYATDADEEALNQARLGSYLPRQIEEVSPERRERFFQQTDHSFVFRKDLRRTIIFGRHDLVQDAPISRIDLLICRNTLMYFNAHGQAKILGHFHYALNDDGFLFLGRPEMLLSHTDLFTPLELKKRIFSKAPAGLGRERLQLDARESIEEIASTMTELRTSAFETARAAELIVDGDGTLRIANTQARMLFGLRPADIGRPLRDLELSYRPVELRSLIEKTLADGQVSVERNAVWPGISGDAKHLDVDVVPLFGENGTPAGVSIAFTDVTRFRKLQDDLQSSKHELETAYEELQATVEELETTNEELHSTNEELETTNEESQSTNEELETMNEELQSTIEELETINQELEDRTGELNAANVSHDAILRSINVGIIVLDRDLRITGWNDRTEDLWGLRWDEVRGQHLMSLDIGLSVDTLRGALRDCMQSGQSSEVQVEAVTRRGKTGTVTVRLAPLMTPSAQAQGVILLMEPEPSLG